MSAPLSPRRRRTRVAFVAMAVVVLGILASAARCIERTSTYVDSEGYTHITGEMVNDTGTQGTKMLLQGTLFDANGAVVAQKTAATCPPDSQPHQQIAFDIKFDNPIVAPWTRYEVVPLGGKALPTPLPDPRVVIFSSEAIRFTQPLQLPGLSITTKDVFLGFELRNQSDDFFFGVQGCVAVYDQAGKAVYVKGEEMLGDYGGIYLPAILGPQERTSVFMVATDVPKGPVQVRAWLWFGDKDDETSDYQFVSTGLVTIQSRAP